MRGFGSVKKERRVRSSENETKAMTGQVRCTFLPVRSGLTPTVRVVVATPLLSEGAGRGLVLVGKLVFDGVLDALRGQGEAVRPFLDPVGCEFP